MIAIITFCSQSGQNPERADEGMIGEGVLGLALVADLEHPDDHLGHDLSGVVGVQNGQNVRSPVVDISNV